MIRYLLIALFFFVIGGINLVSQLNKRKNCNVLCSGTIVEVQRRTRKGRRRFTPIYEFTAGGKHIRGDGDVLSTTRRKKYQVGDIVEILYNPENPDEFRVPGKNELLVLSILFLILGICTIIMAVVDH